MQRLGLREQGAAPRRPGPLQVGRGGQAGRRNFTLSCLGSCLRRQGQPRSCSRLGCHVFLGALPPELACEALTALGRGRLQLHESTARV